MIKSAITLISMSDSQRFISSFAKWATGRPSIIGAALVGSYARNTARGDSDIDLVVIADLRTFCKRKTGSAPLACQRRSQLKITDYCNQKESFTPTVWKWNLELRPANGWQLNPSTAEPEKSCQTVIRSWMTRPGYFHVSLKLWSQSPRTPEPNPQTPQRTSAIAHDFTQIRDIRVREIARSGDSNLGWPREVVEDGNNT